MTDLILYMLIGTAVLSSLLAVRLTTTTTGPESIKNVVTLLRLCTVSLWVWFALETGYWQIIVVTGAVLVITSAGLLARSSVKA